MDKSHALVSTAFLLAFKITVLGNTAYYNINIFAQYYNNIIILLQYCANKCTGKIPNIKLSTMS